MKIQKIETENKQDVNQVIQFPFELYNESPFWAPPFVSDVTKTLNRNKHPFYDHLTAEFFLAENEG